jgi:hypothetical protein
MKTRRRFFILLVLFSIAFTGIAVSLTSGERSGVESAKQKCEQLVSRLKGTNRSIAQGCVNDLNGVLSTTTVPTTVTPTTIITSTTSATVAPTTTTTTQPTTGTTVPLGVCPTSDTSSFYGFTRFAITNAGYGQVAQHLWNAGFRDDADLMAGVAIAIGDSGLWQQARNWHPEYDCRPRTDAIGVQGPNSVWDSTHVRQLNSDRGTWQISSHWWPQVSDADADNPAYAAQWVYDIQTNGDGRGWNQWDPYKSGSAQLYYDSARNGYIAVRPAIQLFCQTHACT